MAGEQVIVMVQQLLFLLKSQVHDGSGKGQVNWIDLNSLLSVIEHSSDM